MGLEAFRLDGKIALVTGSRRGIGAAIAVALAQAGADVACHGLNSDPGPACAEIRALGRRTAHFHADVTDPQACSSLIESVVSEFGHLDILVNNAGAIRRAPAAEYSSEFWDEMLAAHLSAAFRLSQLAGRHMLARGTPGKIVNIASLLSFQGGIRVPGYSAAKAGVAGLTKALANEWASKRINVNAIAPVIWSRKTPPPCAKIPCAVGKFSSAFPQDAGASLQTSPVRRFSSVRAQVTTSTVMCSWLTEDGFRSEGKLISDSFHPSCNHLAL